MSPFFSPDGQWVGFAAEGRLKKVSIAGGLPVVLADAPVFFGGTWGPDDTIVFAPTDVGMFRVSSAGGPVTPATALDGAKRGRWASLARVPSGWEVDASDHWDHRHQHGARSNRASFVGDGSRRTLIEGGTNPHYVSSGHIVYGTAGTLMAAPFDLATGTVTGTGVPGLDGISQSPVGAAQFNVSMSGSLVYVPGVVRSPRRSLVWVDRQGVVDAIATPVPPVLVSATVTGRSPHRGGHRGTDARCVGV